MTFPYRDQGRPNNKVFRQTGYSASKALPPTRYSHRQDGVIKHLRKSERRAGSYRRDHPRGARAGGPGGRCCKQLTFIYLDFLLLKSFWEFQKCFMSRLRNPRFVEILLFVSFKSPCVGLIMERKRITFFCTQNFRYSVK